MDYYSRRKVTTPSKPPASATGSAGDRYANRLSGYSGSPRSQFSHRNSSIRMVQGHRLRRRQPVDKEIVMRALTPPSHRPSLRWLNFKPTPSRLSNMSMA